MSLSDECGECPPLGVSSQPGLQIRPYPSAACFSAARRSSSARLTFSDADLSCPHAAMMSRPRGVRTGAEIPALKMMSENRAIRSGVEHS